MDENVLNEMQNNRERIDLTSAVDTAAMEKGNMTPEQRKQAMKAVMNQYKQMYLKRYNIEGIDLDAELKLINEKQSKLSRSRRDAIIGYFMIFPAAENNLNKINENEIEDIGTPATEEDITKVVESIENKPEEVINDGEKQESAE